MKLDRFRRCVENGRLVYYYEDTNSDYWDSHWDAQIAEKGFRRAQRGSLGLLETPFTRWLPREGRILEAGCGMGQVVMALRARGWDAEGLDYSKKTVSRMRELFPDLPLHAGDVTQIDRGDNTYAGYISLGVIEHRQAGPEPYLNEAFRVLRPGGTAIFSVPHMHAIRQWKAKHGKYDSSSDGIPFYQYAFSVAEIRGILAENGFDVVGALPYDGFKGIKDELPQLKRWLQFGRKVPIAGWVLKRWLKHCRFGHMVAMICRKPDVSTQSLPRAA